MEADMNTDGRDHVEDEAVSRRSVKENRRFKEGDGLRVVLPEHTPDPRMITRSQPLIMDAKAPNVTRRPRSTELGFQNRTGITGRTLSPFCGDSTDLCPGGVTNSGCTIRNSRTRGSTHRSRIRLGEFLDDCSSVAESGNFLEGPTARWILDFIEASARRSLINGAVLCKPLVSDGRSTSSSTRNVKTSQLLTSSTTTRSLPSGQPESPATRKVCSDAKIVRELLAPATSSDGCFMTSATVCCFRKSNVPHLMFFSDDYHVYMASCMKVRSSAHKRLDYIYLFHSWNGGRKDSMNEADIVGKMKVSTSLLLNPNRSKSMETEFVLFATDHELAREGQSQHLSHNSRQLCGQSGSPFGDIRQDFATDFRIIENTEQIDRLSNDFLPSHELVAIIVKDHEYGRMNGAMSGGWGLKFLEQAKVDSANSSKIEASSDRKLCSGNKCSSSQTVMVLIPTGFHGGSSSGTKRPSSLVERWMSNGHCDCGGWDVGCPLKVLTSDCNSSDGAPELVPEEGYKPFQLVVQGAKQIEPTFKLLNLTENMYAVYFQPTLSALQSFSVAVAIIHSRTPDLSPKV